MPESNPLQPGRRFGNGRFILIRVLGRGGMGEVWLAQDEHLHEQVALKFLPSEIRGDPVAVDEMRIETARSHKLTHPNIVRIHDLHEDPGGAAFILMEYVDGPTLAALRLQQPNRVFAWAFLRPLVEQLCAALDYAHSEKVIHRDLKPANMMVDSKGRLKLADFGIAALVSDSMSRISVKHSTSGTLPYMSPQQLTGKRPRVTDDIYALGATLYELLTGKPPFYAGDVTHQVLHEPPEPIEERLAALEIENIVPADVCAMVMACLSKEPAHRPQSAGTVAGWIGMETARPANVENDNVAASSVELESADTIARQNENRPSQREKVSGRRILVLLFAATVAVLLCVISFQAARSYLDTHFKGWTVVPLAGGTNQNPVQSTNPPVPPKPVISSEQAAVLNDMKKLLSRPAGSPPASPPASAAAPAQRWVNSLGMVFVPVPGTAVSFSIWDTRMRDYAAYAEASGSVNSAWKNVIFGGQRVSGGLDYPVTMVNWGDAAGFCLWLTGRERRTGLIRGTQSYRLPTDAEWSVAVGLGQETGITPEEKNGNIKGVYPWGTNWPPPAGSGNYADMTLKRVLGKTWPIIEGYDDGYVTTSPVGSFTANQFGLYDMGGNVWQWCDDWYNDEQKFRVARGDSWAFCVPRTLWSSVRYKYAPDQRDKGGGFRCVLAEASP